MSASQGWTARRDNAPRRGLAPGLRKEGTKVEYLPADHRTERRGAPDDGGADDPARAVWIDELLARRSAAKGRG